MHTSVLVLAMQEIESSEQNKEVLSDISIQGIGSLY